MEHSLESYIHRKIVVLSEHQCGFDAAQAMREHHVGCVIVTGNSGEIVGLLTDRDLVCHMMANGLGPDTELGELITSDLIVADENSSLREVIGLMEKYGVRRIPIVKSTQGFEVCVGIVTLDDLIAGQVIEYPHASRIVRSQIRTLHLAKPELADGTSGLLKSFAEKASLKPEHARAAAKFILSALVRRFHYTAAVQFITQLPTEFHLDLLDLPAGPDRTIDDAYIIAGVSSHLHSSPNEAQECLADFWATLLKYADAYKMNHALFQLPREIRRLFQTTELPAASAAPHWPSPPH